MAAPFTALDIVVLLMIALGAVIGALRGFVTEVVSLLAWVAAIVALRLFYAPAAALASGVVGSPSGGAVLGFAVVFLVTFAAVRMVGNALGARTRASVIGPVDRFLGFGFGAVKGLVGASLLFLALSLAYDTAWGQDEPRPEWMRASRTLPLLKVSSRALLDFIDERRGIARPRDSAGYSERARDALGDLLAPPPPKP